MIMVMLVDACKGAPHCQLTLARPNRWEPIALCVNGQHDTEIGPVLRGLYWEDQAD